jgi:hypothetical protein
MLSAIIIGGVDGAPKMEVNKNQAEIISIPQPFIRPFVDTGWYSLMNIRQIHIRVSQMFK